MAGSEDSRRSGTIFRKPFLLTVSMHLGNNFVHAHFGFVCTWRQSWATHPAFLNRHACHLGNHDGQVAIHRPYAQRHLIHVIICVKNSVVVEDDILIWILGVKFCVVGSKTLGPRIYQNCNMVRTSHQSQKLHRSSNIVANPYCNPLLNTSRYAPIRARRISR